MHLSLIDFGVIIAYGILIFTLAQLALRQRPDPENEQGPIPFGRNLPWWAIGTSLIAANISAEQIIGMSGSGYAIGLGVASYEWMSAAALLVVAKYFLPVFLRNRIHTMPEFLKRRFGTRIQFVMAVFWIALYVFVNLSAILWLGATAVHAVAGLSMETSLIVLTVLAGNYALLGGFRSAALTDVVQVSMLAIGGIVILVMALERISGGGTLEGLRLLMARAPDHFHMILKPDNHFYKYLPGLSVIAGGMWIMNLSYWGFNQSIVQGALSARSVAEAQNGIVLAAFLKLLMPVVVVMPGIAAVLLVPNLAHPDQAYPALMLLLPSGLLGLAFVALIAAIIASMGSTVHSITTIFTDDLLRTLRPGVGRRMQMIARRAMGIFVLVAAMVAAKPLLGNFDQAFQYIQDFTGFLTPGIVAIFLLGMAWRRTTENGAMAAAVGSVVFSYLLWNHWPHIEAIGQIPFLHRVGIVFLICLALAAIVSFTEKPRARIIDFDGIDYSTGKTFNAAAVLVVATLVALYAAFW